VLLGPDQKVKERVSKPLFKSERELEERYREGYLPLDITVVGAAVLLL
jgi:hypothetical protein